MSAPVIAPPHQGGIAKWIRRLCIPIIIGWIALIGVLNTVVPQLEVVGQMRSVSMTPDEAPSVIAMKRVGAVFDEFHSNSSAMIVLEGDQPLGPDSGSGMLFLAGTSSSCMVTYSSVMRGRRPLT